MVSLWLELHSGSQVKAALGDLFIWALDEGELVRLQIVIESGARGTGDNRAVKLTGDGTLSLCMYTPGILRGKLCYDRWHSAGRDDVILWKHQAHSHSGISFLSTDQND